MDYQLIWEIQSGAESGVSWTRFDTNLTLTFAICQIQDIFCIRNRAVPRQRWEGPVSTIRGSGCVTPKAFDNLDSDNLQLLLNPERVRKGSML
jgi:hypothetical protein